MGFKAYRFTSQNDDSWRLETPEPLRFSGPQGLIAQWYRANRLDACDGAWIVPAREWLALAYGAAESARRWIIFEQAEGGIRKYARLERINGQFGSQTRIVMQFRPLQCTGFGEAITVIEPEYVCGWSEELSIDGGDGSASCSWRWMAPKLGFAAVTAG